MHDRALIVCSIWLHVSYIGAASVAIGLIRALAADAPLASSIALVFAGTALAIGAWDRAYAALEARHPGRDALHHLHHARQEERELRPVGHDD